MLKVYGIHNRTQAIIKVPLNNGRAWLECEFKHGRIGAGMGNRPATYPTSDVTEQNIIEDSPLFGTLIHLVRVAGADAPKRPDTPAVSQPVPYPDVTSKDEAIAFLKAHGAKAINLKSDDAIKNYMEKISVTFPNLSF